MSTDKIIQVTSDSELDILIKIDAHQLNDEDKSRIREDFHQGYFQAYFYSSSGAVDLNSITAYVVTYFSYSTWQNRVLCISDFWLASTLDEAAQLEILELFRQRLFSIARLNNCKRINFHVKHSDMNQTLIRCLEKFGMRNLTREEDWNIFQLSTNELKEFIKDGPKLDDEFKIIKVEDMSLYASHIHGHIHELAVFEKLEEQFECSTEELLTDYDEGKCPTKRRLYEAMVMLNKENKTVGFAIYYTIYNLKSGIGFYLEDLFVQEAYRHRGLGTSLWKRVADDCVKLKGNYMQWAVLGWNTPAINFYYKFKSINLTETEKLNLFRFLTHQIYEKC